MIYRFKKFYIIDKTKNQNFYILVSIPSLYNAGAKISDKRTNCEEGS